MVISPNFQRNGGFYGPIFDWLVTFLRVPCSKNDLIYKNSFLSSLNKKKRVYSTYNIKINILNLIWINKVDNESSRFLLIYYSYYWNWIATRYNSYKWGLCKKRKVSWFTVSSILRKIMISNLQIRIKNI